MAVGFASGDAVMVLQDGQRKRGRFVEEVKEGYEVALRHESGKRYLSPQVFERDLVSTPTAEDMDQRAHAPSKSARLAEAKYDHRVEVMLKKASIGKVAASLGIELQRTDLDLVVADESLREARINCRLSVEPDQEELFEGNKPEMVSVANVGKLSVGGGTITCTLTFQRGDCDLDALADFAQKNATLDFSRVGERQTQATTTEGEGE